MVENKTQWNFGFLLPNLSISDSIGSEYVTITHSNDPRVKTMIKHFPSIKYLLEGITDQFSRKVHPSLLIFSKEIPEKSISNNAIIDFRNMFAISCIVNAWKRFLIQGQWFINGQYSEYFRLYPIIPRITDNFFTIISPAVLGLDEPENFHGQTDAQLAGPAHNIRCDTYLFDSLNKAWEERHINGMFSDMKTTILFRSLQTAFQASSMPNTNYQSIYDYGATLSQWVSAFEILAHSVNQNVGFRDVLNLIGCFPSQFKQLTQKIYNVDYYRSTRTIIRGTLPQKLYRQIYDARNDFIHGNQVSIKHLFPWYDKKRHPLYYFAPLLYEIALICFLEIYPKEDIYTLPFEIFSNIRILEDGLLKSKEIITKST